MIKGVTKNGFCFEIDEARADNMEFLEALAETQENAQRVAQRLADLITQL